MAENAGLIFLSHAKEDKPFVDKVKSMLDTSVLFYDIRSIAPGQDSVSAMRGAVSSASVFVLFHSPNANSHWIRYEKDLAEITRIKSPTMQILVCPLDGESYKTLPEWMQRYMTTLPSFKPNDIARTIDHLYTIANKLGSTLYEGREDLERDIALDIRTAPAKLGCPLNVILLAGVQGMGRGAIGKSLVRRAFLGCGRQARSLICPTQPMP